jgi:hypothetical protein
MGTATTGFTYERYSLVGGDSEEFWVIDSDPRGWDRNPLFRIQSHDKKFAHEFLAALNRTERLRDER